MSAARQQRWEAFARHVQDAPGHLDPATRRAIFAAAECDDASTVPADLRAFTEVVARHAYRVTDEDVAVLRAGGRSEDQLFEAAVSAAAGAGSRRLRAAHAAMGRR